MRMTAPPPYMRQVHARRPKRQRAKSIVCVPKRLSLPRCAHHNPAASHGTIGTDASADSSARTVSRPQVTNRIVRLAVGHFLDKTHGFFRVRHICHAGHKPRPRRRTPAKIGESRSRPIQVPGARTTNKCECGFQALEKGWQPLIRSRRQRGELQMKKIALALVAVLSLLSIAGCTTAPPPPTVTKG
jgi:hypothetical protein